MDELFVLDGWVGVEGVLKGRRCMMRKLRRKKGEDEAGILVLDFFSWIGLDWIGYEH